ncbi:hypothetical protein ALA22_gp3 [Torque teno mini virus ALA22]|uniref:DUF755 domain-containing protein n=1 Tax=Torque teno mini virus ALA22 TaxID=1535290 RepID=A0A076V2K4_9VIRU|nr:hypothetical protein ALA22_gp3 [Torque teno mini virus ALA22]AIK19237.1 hypothetical protein ALA22_gp3 [Torque teno mini virus ALA22]
MFFTLSLGEHHLLWPLSQNQTNNQNIPLPITSSKHLRCRVQHLPLNTSSTTSTKDEVHLQKKLLKESQNTKRLNKLFSRLQNQLYPATQHPKKKHRHQKHRTRKKKKCHSRNSSSSSESSKDSSESESTNSSTD